MRVLYVGGGRWWFCRAKMTGVWPGGLLKLKRKYTCYICESVNNVVRKAGVRMSHGNRVNGNLMMALWLIQ